MTQTLNPFGVLEQPALDAATSFRKREPAVLTHLLSGLVFSALSLLVTHGVIGSAQASALTQQVVALAIPAILTGQGFVLRRYVNSKWKTATGHDLPSEITDEPDPDPEPEPHPLPGPGAELVAAGVTDEQHARLAGEPPLVTGTAASAPAAPEAPPAP